MTSGIQAASPTVGGSDDDGPYLADVPGVFSEGTFVLVEGSGPQRDTDDPVDVHEAEVGPGEPVGPVWAGVEGPAWRAKDLYKSTEFAVRRQFAEKATQWARNTDK